MAMTPANDAFTLNNRYSLSHSRRDPNRSPSPTAMSMGLGKLKRRNNSSMASRRLSHGGTNGSALEDMGGSVRQSPARRYKTSSPKSVKSEVERKIDWEIPRKTLHASIGFFVIPLYTHGYTTRPVIVILSGALVVISAAEALRLRNSAFEQLYERCLGPLMRHSEKHKVNGVVWYIIGVLIVLGAFPMDIAVVSILILSWADTSASTFGRLWGQLTPPLPPRLPLLPLLPSELRPRLSLPLARRKSLAGFIAASVTGSAVAAGFWGWIAPMRQADALWSWDNNVLGGWIGLGVLSVVTGLVAGLAEALDLGSLDDNLTLPVVSGGVLWAFLRAVRTFW